MRRMLVIFSLAVLCAAAQGNLQSTLPSNLRVPATQKLLFQAHGVGGQIYTCKAATGTYAWTLEAPDAQLLDIHGEVLGRHFAGPTWEAKDGSSVVGKAVATAASPDPHSVPWLLLDAIRHEGNGRMNQVLSIQRLDTKGGKAPANGCDDSHVGAETRVPYEAEYYFYGNIK
jgi:hypothetical protein